MRASAYAGYNSYAARSGQIADDEQHVAATYQSRAAVYAKDGSGYADTGSEPDCVVVQKEWAEWPDAHTVAGFRGCNQRIGDAHDRAVGILDAEDHLAHRCGKGRDNPGRST